MRKRLLGFAVVVVLALGVVGTSATPASARPSNSACEADESSLSTAEEAFYSRNGHYATMKLLIPKYIKRASKWHTIAVNSSGADFTVIAKRPCL